MIQSGAFGLGVKPWLQPMRATRLVEARWLVRTRSLTRPRFLSMSQSARPLRSHLTGADARQSAVRCAS